MRPNILITSAGQDGQVLRTFQRELDSLLPNGTVLAAGAVPDHLAYAQQLLDTCISKDVSLGVPTGVEELPKLARHRREFAKEGIAIAVSDPRFVDMTRDKRTMAHWFRQRGLQTPRAINSAADANFPIVAVPDNNGVNRQSTVVTDAAQFASLLLDDPQLMFTEYLSPREFEAYTVDMCYSEDGTLKLIAARRAVIPAIAAWRERVEKFPGARGCITLRLCVHGRTGAVYGIDIKAGFDEDHPHGFGADVARTLTQEYLLKKQAEFSRRQAA